MTTRAMTTRAMTTGAVTTGAVTTGAVTTGAVTTGAVTTRAVTTRAVTTRAVTTGQIIFADPEIGPIDDIVDTERYPIDGPDGPDGARWRQVVESVRRQLDDDGCATLDGFVRPDAVEIAREQIAAVAPHAMIRRWEASVHASGGTEGDLDADDPRRVRYPNLLGHVTRDQIPPDSIVSRLYVSPVFKKFVAACVGEERLFEYADPLAGLIATIVPPGGEKSWHYDTNEYVVTMMTQRSDGGGDFEYHPDLRRPHDENLDGLRDALAGRRSPTVKSLDEGDLQLFLGRYSLHRVTPVTGDRERHVAVLSYAPRPGVIAPLDRTRAVYGRVTEAHLVADRLGSVDHDGLLL